MQNINIKGTVDVISTYGIVLFILFIQNVYADKQVFKKKGQNIMYSGSNPDRKPPLSDILTEPLNPHDICIRIL